MKMINDKRLQFLFAVAFLIVLLTSCNLLNSYLDDHVDPLIAEPSVTSIFADVDGIECIPDISSYEVADLVSVIDGDSIKVTIGGEPYQVRYIGINTPEYYSDERVAAIAASNENEHLLAVGPIYLFKDQSNTDKYDRLLRYVVVNGRFVNLELVRSGHALSTWYRPDISCQIIFDQAVLK